MVNGLHLYSAFIQSALQFLPLIHPFTHTFTHTFTHQRRLAAMQGTNQLVRSNWGLGVLLRDTSIRPGWDRTGNPPTARRLLYLLSHIAPQWNEKWNEIVRIRRTERPGAGPLAALHFRTVGKRGQQTFVHSYIWIAPVATWKNSTQEQQCWIMYDCLPESLENPDQNAQRKR